MKKIIILLRAILFISTTLSAITVDGNAYLENQTNHSVIEVLFERTAPSSLTDSTYTDSNGYYSINIETGWYDITYSKDRYNPESLNDQSLFADTTLPDVTLLEHLTMLNVPSDFTTIQSAIDYAWTADTVLVQPGTYYENINFSGKNITVASLFLTTQDTSYISQTVIDGNQNGRVVKFENNEDYNAVLTGFTITNGEGGILCSYGSNPSLENLTISNNYASYCGGGILFEGSNAKIENITIKNNSAYEWGGGIHCDVESSPDLQNVKIINNSVPSGGGGGIGFNWDSSPSLKQVDIFDNMAVNGGGVHIVWGSNPNFENVNISNNTANTGGGIYIRDNANPNLVNCIVSNNLGNYGIYVYSGSSSITYSDFYNNENGNFYNCGAGVGINVMTNANGDSCDCYYNIQMDPLFVHPASGDYHLTQNSPCIDAGDPNSPLDPDSTIADMGAYYYNQNIGVDEPEEFTNYQVLNYPNPFKSTTSIKYSLPKSSNVKIQIYNVKGQLVKILVNENKPAGLHSVEWNAENMSSGIYFYKLSTKDKTFIKKMILLR